MLPPRKEIKNVLDDENAAVEFLFMRGIISKPKKCGSCSNHNVKLKGKRWRCSLKACQKSESIFKVGLGLFLILGIVLFNAQA